MTLFDAHCHLQDPRLDAHRLELLKTCRRSGIQGWMLNSTRESDWASVAALAQAIPGVCASFGLHPWWQKERTQDWPGRLEAILRAQPEAGIGETGLDRWMPAPDLVDQSAVLEIHLELARQLQRPISLHCLKAWPELKSVFCRQPLLPQGFLLHSYAAPPEMTDFWVKAGAYFSFSPAFLHPRKRAQRAAFVAVPLDRLLLETDAPDMAPPVELELQPLHSPTGERLNHPVNLRLCLSALARDRELSEPDLATILRDNSRCLFGVPLK